jgi:AraC family transcriptional regulator
LAKIAVESDARGPAARRLASGDGWAVSDVVCTAGPRDRPFEEQHSRTSIAVVVSGTFQYRSPAGRELMTPGSLLLADAGDCFRCGHEHGTGDHCVCFSYAPEFFERLREDAESSAMRFKTPRLPPIRPLSPLVAKTVRLLTTGVNADFEELGIQIAVEAIRLGTGMMPREVKVEASSLARVTRVVRTIESAPDVLYDLTGLARIAGLSSYHFLRTFMQATGATPHQYLLRSRLQRAAVLLKTEPIKILDIALGCGFGDVSNFNRAFRAEFGMSPRVYRSNS